MKLARVLWRGKVCRMPCVRMRARVLGDRVPSAGACKPAETGLSARGGVPRGAAPNHKVLCLNVRACGGACGGLHPAWAGRALR